MKKMFPPHNGLTRRTMLTAMGVVCAGCVVWLGKVLSMPEGANSGRPRKPVSGADSGMGASRSVGVEEKTSDTGKGGGTSKPSVSSKKGVPLEASGYLSELYECLRETSEDVRRKKFLELIEKMRPEDARAVQDLFGRLKKEGQAFSFEWSAFWRRWGMIDPQSALEFAESRAAAGDSKAYERLFQGWGETNLDAARQWLSQNGSSPRFAPAYLGFLDGYARKDLDAATRLTLSSMEPDDPLMKQALGQLQEHAFKTRYAAGMEAWFDQYISADPKFAEVRKQAIQDGYKMLLQVDTKTATQWVGGTSKDPNLARNFGVIDDAANRYAKQNPAAAMDFVTNIPPNAQNKIIGLGRVVGEWAKQNPQQLEGWLNANQQTGAFGAAAATYAGLLAAKDPGKALYWANQVPDPTMRANLIQQLQHPPVPKAPKAAKPMPVKAK